MILLKICVETHYYIHTKQPRWWRPFAYANKKEHLYLHKVLPNNPTKELIEKAKYIKIEGARFKVDEWSYNFDTSMWEARLHDHILGFSGNYLDRRDFEEREAMQVRDENLAKFYATWSRGRFELPAGDSYRALRSAG